MKNKFIYLCKVWGRNIKYHIETTEKFVCNYKDQVEIIGKKIKLQTINNLISIIKLFEINK